jgi:hypothetical protein
LFEVLQCFGISALLKHAYPSVALRFRHELAASAVRKQQRDGEHQSNARDGPQYSAYVQKWIAGTRVRSKWELSLIQRVIHL